MEEEKEFLYWLCQIPSLGAASIRKLGEFCRSFCQVYYIEERHLAEAELLNQKQAEELRRWKKKLESCREEYHKLREKGIQFISPLDADYPKRLLHIYDYPMGLYVRGALPSDDLPTAAIIGARSCSSYGQQTAVFMGRELAGAGVQIISGLASGIDGAGHKGALEAGGRTFGVLGSGINICYPPENYPLYEAMAKTGGILTEFAMGESPRSFHFPMRNRIISGLSDAVLVIEAKERSGSLITAGLGLDQGKEIFALPGRITDPCSAGCNRLIQQGANPLLSAEEVAEFLGAKSKKMLKIEEKCVNGLAKTEKIVYSCLDLQPKVLEQIVAETKLPVGICANALLNLELAGYIIRTVNNDYGKRL